MHEHPHTDTEGLLSGLTQELKDHAPFTFAGALSGVVIALVFAYVSLPENTSRVLFAVLHPTHVFFSAIATTAMFRLHARRSLVSTLLVGYIGAVGIGTLSDSIIPYLSELFLAAHDEHVHAHLHLGFIEEWYLVNPLALLGIAIACICPETKVSHAGHVLLSTWASLFHILMALEGGGGASVMTFVLIPVVLFLAVWVPCCTSDIIFPILCASDGRRRGREGEHEE